jgi:hypothetical protein
MCYFCALPDVFSKFHEKTRAWAYCLETIEKKEEIIERIGRKQAYSLWTIKQTQKI